MKLTDEEIKIKVTEALGWRIASRVHPDLKLHACMCWIKPEGEEWQKEQIPNYPLDLNACAEFEATLPDEEHLRYGVQLWNVVIAEGDETTWDRQYISATARQRCIAYLKTKGIIP